MTPHCSPVVEPDRHTAAPTATAREPVTGIDSATSLVGVQAAVLVTRIAPKSSPGKSESATGPISTPFAPAQLPPSAVQCPAVSTNSALAVRALNPIEHRPPAWASSAWPPTRSVSSRGSPATRRTRTGAVSPAALLTQDQAAPSSVVVTTTELVAASTYQLAIWRA